jgi:hypothetical protein
LKAGLNERSGICRGGKLAHEFTEEGLDAGWAVANDGHANKKRPDTRWILQSTVSFQNRWSRSALLGESRTLMMRERPSFVSGLFLSFAFSLQLIQSDIRK